MGKSLRFGVLGPVTVIRDGVSVPVTGAMPRAILAALLMEANKPVSAGRLATGLWGDNPPRCATASLGNHVYRLRRHLDDADRDRIRVTGSGYVIRIRDGELDLHDFARSYDRGHRALIRRDWTSAAAELYGMLALWRGDPVANVEGAVLSTAERERLSEMRLQALGWRIDAELHLGRHAALVAELRALIGEHPLNETFPAHLMLALHRSGRHADALAVYQRTRIILRNELGVSPGRELAELHRRILGRDPALDWRADPVSIRSPEPGSSPRPGTLPADIGVLVGRDTQIDRLLAVLEGDPGTGSSPIAKAAIGGMCGVGKTTLAVHVAHRVRDRFPGGQLFANLRGKTSAPARPAAVLAMFLRQLGVGPDALPHDEEERSALFRSLLADRRVLVLLDDARDAAQVRPLIPGGAHCGLLVTARRRLAGLPGWAHLDLDQLSGPASRELLVRIIGAERVDAESDATDRVLTACAGLPLALSLAGARLAARTGWRIRDLADRLDVASGMLDQLTSGDQSVRASFETGYAGLAEPDGAVSPSQRLFCLLALRSDPTISLSTAASLMGLSAHEAERLLEGLVDANLLRSSQPGRYELHRLLRVFAAERAHRDLPVAERPGGPSAMCLLPPSQRLVGTYG